MRTNRRQFLKNITKASGIVATAPIVGIGAGLAAGNGSYAHAAGGQLNAADNFNLADLRGSVNANTTGLMPGAISDQGVLLQNILEKAAASNKPVFLPPGDYFVSNITLPKNTRLMGVPGASRLIYTGSGHFIIGENGQHIELTGLVFDGANRGLSSYAEAAIRLTNVEHAVIDNCKIIGSLEMGIQIARSKGRISNTHVSGAAGECGIYAIENRGLSIINNEVTNCVNGGILVHRWDIGSDGTIVSGNRVSQIGAGNGGTGQWGNGINIFRAGDVIVTNNHISDCAFSAIRGNAANNVQMTGNTCLRSGETAIYSEFEFNGSVINSNIVDGAARGISIANFLQGGHLAVVGNNLIRNIVGHGPYVENDQPFGEGISVEADTTVTGNVIEQAASFGIMLGWGPYLRDVVVSNNVIRRVNRGVYVSVVKGSGSAHISNNIISATKKGGIFGYEWKNLKTKDLAKNYNNNYSHLTIENNKIS